MELPEIEPWDWSWLDKRGNYMTLITPELATKLLERNTHNRTPRSKKIEQFARDMKRGHWDPDASDLKFDREGRLLDGQNRLMACEQSGTAFATLVRTGLFPETQSKVDTGTARTAADALKMAGIQYGPALASAVALRMRHSDRILNHDRKRGFEARPFVPTHDEILGYLSDHPTMEQMAGRAEHLSKSIIPAIPRSVTIACLGWFAEVSEPDTIKFYEAIREGHWGGPGDPLMSLIAYAARIRGGVRKGGSPGARGRTAQEETLMAMVKVWNAWRQRQPIQLLSVKREERLEVPV